MANNEGLDVVRVVVTVSHRDGSGTAWDVSPSGSAVPLKADGVCADGALWARDAATLDNVGLSVPPTINARTPAGEVWINWTPEGTDHEPTQPRTT